MMTMTKEEEAFSKALSKLIRCNPFSPRWADREREALGAEYVAVNVTHFWHEEKNGEHPNLKLLGTKVKALVDRLSGPFASRANRPHQQQTPEMAWYVNLVFYLLYRNCRSGFDDLIRGKPGESNSVALLWSVFLVDYDRYLPEERFPSRVAPSHLFACFYQIRRAFNNIFKNIVGTSRLAIRLRMEVWELIFTRDIHRYIGGDYHEMRHITSLIFGPSGTGKELVAQAIGRSQYIPFDERNQKFSIDAKDTFHAVNLSALTPTLVESELFGHCKGAFTDATQDRTGWLGICGEHTTLFLDEIGDLDKNIQVKLLRVLETREFHRVGETNTRKFEGRIIAATNRNLAREMCGGRFRTDFYYRLCSNVIRTPSLHKQFQSHEEEQGRYKDLRELIDFILRKIKPKTGNKKEEKRIQSLGEKVLGWIDQKLPKDYAWPGNVRELEHCVRSIMYRGRYRPTRFPDQNPAARARRALAALAKLEKGCAWTEDELLDVYYNLVYDAHAKQYQSAAEILGVKWRKVKSRVHSALADNTMTAWQSAQRSSLRK